MKCLIGIIAGEPYSVNSEIIAKAWMERKKLKNIFIIGNYSILKKQFIKLNIKIPLVKIATLKDFKREEKITVPLDLDFNKVKGLSNEIKDILFKVRPHSIAQASKLPGFTPSATLLLLRYIKNQKNQRALIEN